MEDTECRLFVNNEVTQAVLCRLIDTEEFPVLPEIDSTIQALLLQEKNGDDVYAQLDKFMTISLLPPYLQRLCLDKIHISEEHLLRPAVVDDIGHIIRDILVRKSSSNVLFKLYQYTMPFIKHNRLNFPPMRYVSKGVLRHIMQIMSLTCLGLHRRDCKKPTWLIRRKLFRFFTHLTTEGTLRDIYIFCLNHNYLLRLALMENFVNYTSTHMRMEIEILCRTLKWTSYEHARVERLVFFITDNFRTCALQNEDLDWNLCELKAQQAIERCNRTCKSQALVIPEHPSSFQHCIDGKVLSEMVKLPVITQVDIIRNMQTGSFLDMAVRWNMIKHICKYPLPLPLQQKHFKCISRAMRGVNKHNICLRSQLHVCLMCNQQHPGTTKNMRFDHAHRSVCVVCHSSDFVLCTDTLGHLVKVFENYYYFCTICLHVHLWTGRGSEFFTCHHRRPAQASRHCVVCFRTMHLSPHYVFDKRLGVMQQLFLCSKHNPTSAQMQYVHDLCSLRELVKHIS